MVEVDHPAADVEVRQEVHDTGDVIGRHAQQSSLIVLGAAEFHCADHIGGEVAVAQDHRFGAAVVPLV